VIIKFSPATDSKRPLSANYDWKDVESRVRKFYDDVGFRSQIDRKLSKKKPIGWYEGPPTLNNQSHLGHVRGRTLKDIYFRHSTMHGERIVFRGGWDTQGLPVELQAEKELGLTGSKWENLRQVGVEKLVQACKDLISKYRSNWEELDYLLGLRLDQERAYMTYRDGYIEREWKYLETAWKQGILGEGFKVVPYCPSCQTSLSQAEIALGGYELLEDPSLYYKVKAGDGAFLTVWTTMPFTVVTDELVGVKPEAEYEYVSVGDETWIVGSERKAALSQEIGVKFGTTLKTVRGKDLEGLHYAHPLLDKIPGLKKLVEEGRIHKVVAEEFVDTSTGTGMVHISPANGEEDFAVAQERGLPTFGPIDDEAKFTEEAGTFSGLFVRDADKLVVQLLRESGSLIHEGRINHDYPVCWRSGHRIVWLSRREYFYWVDRKRNLIVEAADRVEYFSESPKNRFMEFLRESPPWCITRERVWGTPLPIWVCTSCGEKITAFSRKRIVELAKELPDGPNFELHRPWMDRIVMRCPKCGGDAQREPFVLDTWHNSGSAPYASFSDDEYRELVPVRFLTEGIDQTRGWAYTLLVLNVIMRRRPLAPYKSFLFQGHVLDEQGRKMSKSLGNVIWGLDLLRSNSADLARFYLTWKISPMDSLSVNLDEMASRPYQVLNTIYHLHVYVAQNGSVDGYNPRRHTVAWARQNRLLTVVDEWLLSKLSAAEAEVEAAYTSARHNEACRTLEEMVIGQVSQRYVRLVRAELWRDDEEGKQRRLAIYATLGYVLQRLDADLHPVIPYLTEYLYQEVFAGSQSWSKPIVVAPPRSIPMRRKQASEQVVEFALGVEDACNAAREKAKLKRRWPLHKIQVLVKPDLSRTARKARPLISSLCNVRDTEILSSPERFPATFSLLPNSSKIGAIFKKETGQVLKKVHRVEGSEALNRYLLAKGEFVDLESGKVEVPSSVFQLSLKPQSGHEVVERDGVFVAIEKTRDEGLVAEGLARDLARRLQSLRKTRGFTPTAVLSVAQVAGLDEDELSLLAPLRDNLAFLVRVREVRLQKEKAATGNWVEDDLDGRPIFLDVS
jgi:isoleucyl-tRNA synthetase